MKSKISVIIPVYNVEAYLERCLRSVMENTYQNLEILCINDGSTDGSALILKKLAEEDPRIKVFTKINGGVSSARNLGLNHATGEYISFIDSDDWIHPQFFEILMYHMLRENYDLVLCDFIRSSEPSPYDTYDPAEHPAAPLDLEEIYQRHYAKSFVWGRLYRKSFIGSIRFEESIGAAEDIPFTGTLFATADRPRIVHVPLVLCYYFHRVGSLSQHISAENMLQSSDVFFHCANISSSTDTRALFLIESLKNTLSAWYMFHLRGDRSDVKKCRALLKSRLQNLEHIKEISAKKKLRYSLLCRIPTMYRLWRIVNDPTMIAHERNMYRYKRQR